MINFKRNLDSVFSWDDDALPEMHFVETIEVNHYLVYL